MSNKKIINPLMLLCSLQPTCPARFCFFAFPLSIFLPVPTAILLGFFSISSFPILSLFCHSHSVPPALLGFFPIFSSLLLSSSLRSLFLSFGLAF
ncbi:hypothetical protein GLYMA_19G112400v4 [Glycine max]|uniref:Uncharacterized protein n=1 Tax=Glycine max TaxID=3847 RepID=A0A0R0EVD4_SOYBN|nr:hypothetical protein JHK86_053148 [Glycine max]KAG4927540.1 hypothetical protein JHK85_054026 [Glycine max]KAG4927603.1 hypothetical protein JHK85_054089 [Glycine max]KAG5083136.1 hypothetical protein JHK84_053174 [Glycine max]KAH1077315.1 hypothetical protein GYH30_052720 [Glycine max]